jgi:peptidoglycan lytic transglycosylase A
VPARTVPRSARTHWRFFLPLLLSGLFGGCALMPPAAGIGEPVAWSQLPGWNADDLAQAWPALRQDCRKMPARDPRWNDICADAALFPDPDDDTARAFFETRFEARAMRNGHGDTGLVTGYYEPLLNGSLAKTARFRYPIYRRPDDLVTVDLGSLYPELAGKTVRGRLDGRRVVPYYSRAEIREDARPLAGDELLWVDDPVALFFLQVQGSGRVRLPDGRVLFVGYADQNGHPYQSIARRLVEIGAMKLEDANLESVRAWLETHPDEADAVLNSNPSFVFFTLRDPNLPGPIGSLNVPLTAQRSIAVDPAYIPLGTPVWLDTTLPNDGVAPYQRLMFAQDTGGAIKGAVRADLFFGFGDEAERLAGSMKQPGRMYALVPRPRLAD